MSRIADMYRRIAEANRPEIFIALRPQADVEADYRRSLAGAGPLSGIVLAVKDNVDVAGLPTTAGCPGFGYLPSADAPAVATLKQAGAVVIGKTNLDQFATGLVGTRSPYGAVRDARRPDHISGGSSSGSAVAVAMSFADIAIGTDTAGSGRIPAGLQGIVGLKPTVGVVSNDGVVPACASYDCVTVFARDLGTAERAMGVLAGGGGRRQWPGNIPLAAPTSPKVAVPAELPALDDSWRKAFGHAVERAHAVGIETVEIDLTAFLAAARLLYEGALVAERWDAVGQFIADATPNDAVDPTVAAIISGADRFSAVDLLRDRARVEELRRQAMAQLSGCDALLVPTAPRHPTIAEVDADPIGVNAAMGTYTNFCNLFDMCAISIPAGTVDEGHRGIAQFGVTVLAPAFHDAVVADLARRMSDAGDDIAPSWAELAGAPVRELAVFGAHLRGQPLDFQLTGRGARWAGPLTTSANYALTELDTTPPKPGLLRTGAGGVAIAGERWVLSVQALGEFLAELPAPMMLGSVELDDGSWTIGFGCDHVSGTTARDISHFGGWLAARRAAVG